MKKLIFLFCALCASHLFAQQEGTLDGDFDGDGFVNTYITGYDFGGTVKDIVVLPDGKILALATAYAGFASSPSLFFIRLNPDGGMDNSFGPMNDGIVKTFYEDAEAMITLPDGRIVTGGSWTTQLGGDFWIGGFVETGLEAEVGFHTKTTSFGPNYSAKIKALALQSNGMVVAAGGAGITGGTSDFALARYSTYSEDSTFSFDGKLTTDIGGGTDIAYSVALQPDGKIVAAGLAVQGGISKLALVHYNSNGSLDNGFGLNGKVVTEIGIEAGLNDLKILPDGKILAAGYSFDGNQNYGLIVRYLANGNLDSNFGNGGFVLSNDAFFTALAVQPDGKIVTTGTLVSNGDRLIVMRFLKDGAADNSFGFHGLGDYIFSAKANTIALQQDGRIVVAGYSLDAVFQKQILVARYHASFTSGTINPLAFSSETIIYPNPVPAEATFGFELESAAEVSLSIMDIYGKVLQHPISTSNVPAGQQEVPLSLEDLLPGNYLLVLQAGGHVVTMKFIKN